MTYIYYGDTLYHHGIKGQKWGVRQYQNEDGSLTAAGRIHYGYGDKERARAEYYESKVKTAKTNFGKRLAIRNAENNRLAADYKDIRAEAKRTGTKVNSIDYDIGYRKANAKFHKRMAETYKEGSRRRMAYENSAKNDEHFQRLYEKQKAQGMSAGKRFASNLKDDLALTSNNRTTWSGRKTTALKEAGLAFITNGLGNIVLDEIYYRRNKNN